MSSAASRSRLSPQRARVLRVVSDVSQDEQPVLLHTVSDVVGGHPNTSRLHLEALVDAGLLEARSLPPTGVGRPPRGYTLTQSGRRELLRRKRSHNHEIVSAVAAYVAQGDDPVGTAESIGSIWGVREAEHNLEAVVADAAESVVEILDILGFEPTLKGTDEVVLHACPLLEGSDGVETTARFACAMHSGMVRGALRHLGYEADVEIVPFSGEHLCTVRLLRASS